MSLHGRKPQSDMDLPHELSPNSRATAPPVQEGPLPHPEHLRNSPRPARVRKPTQKAVIEAEENRLLLPPNFSVPRISGRRKSSKKRAHQSSDDEADDIGEADDDNEYGTKLKVPRKRRDLSANTDIEPFNNFAKYQVITSLGPLFPHLLIDPPREYKSPYQQNIPTPPPPKEPSIECIKPLESSAASEAAAPTSSVEPSQSVETAESVTFKKSAKNVKKPTSPPKKRTPARRTAVQRSSAFKADLQPRAPSARVSSAKAKAKVSEAIKDFNDDDDDLEQDEASSDESMASSSRPPPQGRDRRDSLASVDRLVQQHRTLVTTLAGNMTHQQLMNLVIEGACDDEANGILFNRLIKASNEARGISQYPSPSPAAQPSSATPTNPDAHTNGGSHNHRRSESSRHRSERSSSLNGTTVASNASRRHSNDFADDMAISDDEDIPAEVPRKMTATQLDRFRAREKRGDQWITSSKAYLIPEGRTPPKKGPVPVGVAKKRKNVVTAGFDYRMRFHYRMTKHDREGNLVSKEGHTPAIRREQVDFHPTLANLSEECFFREVLRRQLDHEARGVAY